MPDLAYIAALQRVIVAIYHCASKHVETVRVEERNGNVILWEGDVEVFAVPDGRRCFAWIPKPVRAGDQVRFVALLESSTLRTPLDAVKWARVTQSATLVEEFSRWVPHR